MSISGFTSLAWLVLVAVYGLRVFLAFAPGGELLWKACFRGETGVLDRAEAVLWLPVIVLSALCVLQSYRRQGFSLTTLWYLGMGALCVFLLGEEVSWGQHIIGFESSERMQTINAQGESNLHNLNLALILGIPPASALYPWLTNFNHILNPAYYLLSCVLFIAIPVAKNGLGWRIVAWIPAPSSRITLFFAANVVAYLAIDKLVFDVGEIFELAITMTFALTALDVYRQSRPVDSRRDPRVTARLLGLERDGADASVGGSPSLARSVAAAGASVPASRGLLLPRPRRGGRGTLLRSHRRHAGAVSALHHPLGLHPATRAV
jgi:hypothetical protein